MRKFYRITEEFYRNTQELYRNAEEFSQIIELRNTLFQPIIFPYLHKTRDISVVLNYGKFHKIEAIMQQLFTKKRVMNR